MTPNASKQGKLDSFGAIFLFIFLPRMWGLGFQNDSPVALGFVESREDVESTTDCQQVWNECSGLRKEVV